MLLHFACQPPAIFSHSAGKFPPAVPEPHDFSHRGSRALATTLVLYVTINPSSLRSFKVDLVVSLLPATYPECFMFVLSFALRWLRFALVLHTLIALKELFFRAVT